MDRVLVSLVSEQTIPNVMLINELKGNIDRYLFITTNDMEKPAQSRSNRIIDSSGIEKGNCTKVFVQPNSIDSVVMAIKRLELNYQNHYTVNITGGTKLMAIATMSYFTEIQHAIIVYSFIDSNSYRQISPHTQKKELLFLKKLTLDQYLKAYGLKPIHSNRQVTNPKLAKKIFNRCITANNNRNKLPEIKFAHSKSNADEKAFYSGGWFEEYIFNTIKTTLKLSNSEIAFGVKLTSIDAANEFDVVFVYRHTIHIVECKAYFGNKNIRKKIEEGLYKLGALDDKFGIKAKAYFITNFNLEAYAPRINNSLKLRAKDLKVGFFQMNDIKGNRFINLIGN